MLANKIDRPWRCGRCHEPMDPEALVAVMTSAVPYGHHDVVVAFIAYRCVCLGYLVQALRRMTTLTVVEEMTGQAGGAPWRNPWPIIPIPDDLPALVEFSAELDSLGDDVEAVVARMAGNKPDDL